MTSQNPDLTAHLKLPSPTPPDPPDVAGDIKALAEAIERLFFTPAPQSDYHSPERVWAQSGGADYADLNPVQSVTIANPSTAHLQVRVTLSGWAYQDGTGSAVYLRITRTGTAQTVYDRTAKTASDDTITADRVDIIPPGGSCTWTAQGHKYGPGRPSIKYVSLTAVPDAVIADTIPSYPDSNPGQVT